VTRFRERYLGAESPNPESAGKVLNSTAYRYLSGDQIEEAGMPTAGLTAVELRSRRPVEVFPMPGDWWLAIRIVELRCEWEPDGEKKQTVRVPLLPSKEEMPWQVLAVQRPGESPDERKFLPGTVLDELAKVARHLAWEFFWPEAQATWFVLSGEAPLSPAIALHTEQRKGGQRRDARIRLDVQPWVTASSLLRVHQLALEHVLGRGQRAIGIESLERFEFVENRRAPGITWPRLFELWKSHLAKAGRGSDSSDWRRFARDYGRTRDALLRPLYTMGGDRKAMEESERLWRALRAAKDPRTYEALVSRLESLGKSGASVLSQN
jgi:hypothetical protein